MCVTGALVFDFDPSKGSGGWGKTLITHMLIYRHWVIMTYSERLSDILLFEKCVVYSTKKAIKLLHKPKPVKKDHESVKN